LTVNVFLFAINFLTSPGQWWVLFSILTWGLALLFHARAALSKHVSERALRREKKRLRAERQALQPKRAARTTQQGEKGTLEARASEFGAAVQEGVGQLLSRAAEELRAKTAPSRVRVENANPGRAPAAPDPVKRQTRVASEEEVLTGQGEADEAVSAARHHRERG
jgi:hypothetical protein